MNTFRFPLAKEGWSDQGQMLESSLYLETPGAEVTSGVTEHLGHSGYWYNSCDKLHLCLCLFSGSSLGDHKKK